MLEKPMKETIGPGCFIKMRGKSWSIVFSDKTKLPRQKWKSLSTGNKAVAMSKALEMCRQWESGRYDPWSQAASGVTVKEALKAYRAHKPTKNGIANARMVERIAEMTGITLLAAITPVRIIEFIHKPGRADATLWSYYNKIAACINWLAAQGYFEKNPMEEIDHPPEPKTIPKHFKEDELEVFFRGCELYLEKNKKYIHTPMEFPLWYMVGFELIAFTGLRKTEAEHLNWEDIIWPTDSIGGICVTQVEGPTKNNIDRVITMHPRAERVLRWCEENWRQTSSGSESVLKNFTGKERVSGEFLSRKFTRVKRFVFPDKRMDLHGLRHTYAALLRRKGVPIHVIKEELGHQEIETTMKYGRLGQDERMRVTFERF